MYMTLNDGLCLILEESLKKVVIVSMSLPIRVVTRRFSLFINLTIKLKLCELFGLQNIPGLIFKCFDQSTIQNRYSGTTT